MSEPAIDYPRITRRTLHDEVLERVRDMIIEGRLEPGQRINEGLVGAQLGVSRTPLREAIKILATEGMLELLPNRGARVAAVNEAEIDEMLEVIAGLEANAARLLARRITDSEIADIAELHEAMLEAYERRDEARYFTLNRQIHEAMMRAAKNATLAQIYAGLSSRIQRFRYAAHKTPEQWQRAIDEHEDMLRLMIERDGEQLARLMETHILGKKEPIAAQFGAMGPRQDP